MRRQKLLAALLLVVGAIGLGCSGPSGPVIEDDTTPGVCELHHIPYAVETIPIHYGLIKRATPFTDDEKKLLKEEDAARREIFPHSHMPYSAGGCMVREAKFVKVSYCPECRKADEEWHAKHGRSPWAKGIY